jgi:T-complex protein 1 subunit beta
MARVIPKILREEKGAHEEKGEHARLSSFIGAISVADLVKTTLGPKGMDKILQPMSRSDKVTFTNDGATILKSIPVDNPSAKILIDVSKTQDEEIGDGTTSVAVLCGEFLREAEGLILHQKIHPQTIIRGWRRALDASRQALQASSQDNSKDIVAFREDLFNIARTTLSSKILASHKDHFAKLCVDAIMRLKGGTDLANIQIVKKVGGSIHQSYLEEGFILDKKIGVGQPKRIEKARILVANTALDTDKIKIHGAKVKVDSVQKVADIEKAEKDKMRTKVNKILKHNINCFISRQLIYNLPEQMFTDAKVMAIEHADFEGVERLANVLDSEITSTFDSPDRVKIGRCDLIEEVLIGEDKVIRFSCCAKGEACTIIVRGASKQILDEAERSLHDALCVLAQMIKNTRTVLGGGASEMLMACAVDRLVAKTVGKEAHAVEAFARALRQMPTIIADNAGYDSAELVATLRAQHSDGKSTMGLDMDKGEVGDMKVLKITESLKSKQQVLISAHEAAEMILRVDEIIKCAPRERKGPPGRGHAGHSH